MTPLLRVAWATRLLQQPARVGVRALLLGGTGACALGFVDPVLSVLCWPGFACCLLGVVAARKALPPRRWPAVAAALSLGCAVAAATAPEFGADSPSYYVYLRSLAFDGDLDFADEWAFWGFDPRPTTATGLQANYHAVGSAILWSPFFALGHLYVSAARFLGSGHLPDGYALPYLRSAALGTIALSVGGIFVLARTLESRLEARIAWLATIGTVLASPIPYYLFVQPLMAHGLVFALGCGFVSLWFHAWERPSRLGWVGLGALLGLLAATRWQAAVFVLFFGPLMASGLRSPSFRWPWAGQAALAAALAFTPQLIAWRSLFGSAFAAPQAAHGMDWSSPHLFDVLLSADRGLFTWTPVMALGVLGLLLGPVHRPFAAAGLAVFGASAWVNGGVKDWAGADAFGGRRFDLMVPVLAAGVAALGERTTRAVARRPWLVAAAVLVGAAIWNAGFMRLYHVRTFKQAAPLERVAARQVYQTRHALERLLQRVGGPSARNLAYNMFVGEYFYWNVAFDGKIDVGTVEVPFLGDGWSPPRRRAGWPGFRWALHPRACLTLSLQRPFDLRAFVRTRAPEGPAEGRAMTVTANGHPLGVLPLPQEWTDLPFEVPSRTLVRGPNALCFEFESGVDGDDGTAGAAVALVQLP
jgi:hypothetical protein